MSRTKRPWNRSRGRCGVDAGGMTRSEVGDDWGQGRVKESSGNVIGESRNLRKGFICGMIGMNVYILES